MWTARYLAVLHLLTLLSSKSFFRLACMFCAHLKWCEGNEPKAHKSDADEAAHKCAHAQTVARDARGSPGNGLELWADAPRFEYSDAPLMAAETGVPLDPPTAGARGHAIALSDMQVACVVKACSLFRRSLARSLGMDPSLTHCAVLPYCCRLGPNSRTRKSLLSLKSGGCDVFSQTCWLAGAAHPQASPQRIV